jgi:hypothetical protein
LFVSLYEVDWQAADLQELLACEVPPLLSAAAANLQAVSSTAAATAAPDAQQQQFVSQLADMLYASAVLANASKVDDATTYSSSSSSSDDGSSSNNSSGSACWYGSQGMHQLLDAVAKHANSWDMQDVSRKVREGGGGQVTAEGSATPHSSLLVCVSALLLLSFQVLFSPVVGVIPDARCCFRQPQGGDKVYIGGELPSTSRGDCWGKLSWYLNMLCCAGRGVIAVGLWKCAAVAADGSARQQQYHQQQHRL